jgi:hypothetical protein
MLDAPLTAHLRVCFAAVNRRPTTTIDNEVHRNVHVLIERYMLPALVCIAMIATGIRISTHYDRMDIYDIVYTMCTYPILVIVPFLGPSFAIFYWFMNLANLAVVLPIDDGQKSTHGGYFRKLKDLICGWCIYCKLTTILI